MKLFKCAFLGIVAILLCGCGESGGEFDAINVGKVSVVYENQTLTIAESRGNSSLGASCGDLADFGVFADSSLALHPKSAKNSTTSTANTRIWDLDSVNQTQNTESNFFCHSERSEESKKNPFVILSTSEISQKNTQNRDSSVAMLPQNDKIGAENDKNSVRVAESALDSAPQIEFTNSTQKDFILFFFTSTCGVCKAQLPILEQLSTQGIKIYAILGDVPDISKASAFVRAHKISLPLFYESGARRFFTSAVGGVKGVPVMVVFKNGKIKEKFIGLTPKGTLLRMI